MNKEDKKRLLEIAREGTQQTVESMSLFSGVNMKIEDIALFFENKDKLIANACFLTGTVLFGEKINSLLVLSMTKDTKKELINLIVKTHKIEHDEIFEEIFNLVSGQYLAGIANHLQVSIPHSVPLKQDIGKGDSFGVISKISFKKKNINVFLIFDNEHLESLTLYLEKYIL